MNERFPEERISAYFDGETAAQERADVEKQLAKSSEAQRELDEIRTLSNLLKDLPAQTLSEDFSAQVMQAAERETLLPSDKPSLATGGSGFRRIRWIAAVTASAAVVALIAVVFNSPRRGDRMATAQHEDKTAMPLATDREVADDAVGEVAAVAETLAADPQPELVDVLNLQAPSVVTHDLVFDNDLLSQAKVGDMVKALDTSGEQIAVVKLFVVDRRKGLESFRLLLIKNEIFPFESASETSGAKARPTEQSTDQLTVVYVETNKQRLTAALQQMKSQEFQGLRLENPVQIASLQPDVTSQIGLHYELTEELAEKNTPTDSKKTANRGSETKTLPVEKPESEKKSLIPPNKKGNRRKVELPGSRDATRSRQLSVKVSVDFFDREGGKAEEALKQTKSDAVTAKSDPLFFGKAPREVANKDSHTVRVFFVLVSQQGVKKSPPTKPESIRVKTKAPQKAREEGAA